MSVSMLADSIYELVFCLTAVNLINNSAKMQNNHSGKLYIENEVPSIALDTDDYISWGNKVYEEYFAPFFGTHNHKKI